MGDHYSGLSKHDLFDAIRAVAGQEAVDRLRTLYAGREVRLGLRATVGHWLTDLIGLEAAHDVTEKLSVCDADGKKLPSCFYISMDEKSVMQQQKARCETLFGEGKSVEEVVQITGISRRGVFRYAALFQKRIPSNPSAATERRPRKRTSLAIGLLEQMLIDGCDITKVARRVNKTHEHVRKRLKFLMRNGHLISRASTSDDGEAS